MKIRFSKNWNNKLNCNIFTTIRKGKRDWNKYEGKEFDVFLKGKFFCKAKIIGANKGAGCGITIEELRTDTGIADINDIHRMFGKFGITMGTEVWILTFQRVD